MNRRRVLALLSAGLAATAGCQAIGGITGRRTSDGADMETLYAEEPILEDVDVDPDETRVELFTAERDLRGRLPREERLSQPEELDAFVDGTDFDESYLAVVLRGGAPRTSTLVLEDAERSDDSIHFEVRVDRSDDFQTRDIGFHSLVVRVTRADRPVPDDVTATVRDPEG